MSIKYNDYEGNVGYSLPLINPRELSLSLMQDGRQIGIRKEKPVGVDEMRILKDRRNHLYVQR